MIKCPKCKNTDLQFTNHFSETTKRFHTWIICHYCQSLWLGDTSRPAWHYLTGKENPDVFLPEVRPSMQEKSTTLDPEEDPPGAEPDGTLDLERLWPLRLSTLMRGRQLGRRYIGKSYKNN